MGKNLYSISYNKPKWAIQQITRASGLIEDICNHGVGHPNFDWLKAHDPNGERGFAIHGCDGCCSGDGKQWKTKSVKKLKQ